MWEWFWANWNSLGKLWTSSGKTGNIDSFGEPPPPGPTLVLTSDFFGPNIEVFTELLMMVGTAKGEHPTPGCGPCSTATPLMVSFKPLGPAWSKSTPKG